ncbi:LytR C-terminal domain-containing protein, partial [Catenulispora sp. NF23]|uniref:LytR C-terminal domain-containing protein n=1 Tax=Catenulispora pinistramenti TaxID=2705254 RepID=UPI001BAE313C
AGSGSGSGVPSAAGAPGTGGAPALPPLPAARGAAAGMRPAALAPPDTNTVVDLYNATAKNGLATTVGDWLSASGWPVDKTAGAASQNHTTIFYGKGAEQAAGQLAATLGVQAVPAPSARTTAGHVLIRLGADYTPPGDPQPAAPGDGTGSGATDPANPDPSGTPDPANSPGIAMDNGITCVN